MASQRPRVLVPSDFQSWVNNFVLGYERLGWRCDTGCEAFKQPTRDYDVVHLNWPEELAGWTEPDDAKLEELRRLLAEWRTQTKLVLTVNNLYPHGADASIPYRELYDAFYQAAHVIHHQSHHSNDEVLKRHPELTDKTHVVTSGFNYDSMLGDPLPDRVSARSSLGLDPDKNIIFMFGAVRFASELRLVRRAYQRAKLANTVFVSAINFAPKSSDIIRWRYEVYQWRQWLKRNNYLSLEGFIPDQQVTELIRAADALVVARADSLTSGLPCLALTLERLVIAPDRGSIAEHLAETQNPIYKPGDIKSLSSAMQKLTRMDRASAERENRLRADTWGWEGIISKCLDKLGLEQSGDA